MEKFLEATLPELRVGGVSNLTMKHLDLRSSEGDSMIVFGDSTLSTKDDHLEITFFAHSTYGAEDYIDYGASTGASKINDGKSYTLKIRFIKVKKYGLDKKFNSLDFSAMEEKIREVAENCDAKFYSDDPSWFFQGGWEIADKYKASIYKFPGPNGTGQWEARHRASGGLRGNIYLTKHLAQVVDAFDSYIPMICQSLVVK